MDKGTFQMQAQTGGEEEARTFVSCLTESEKNALLEILTACRRSPGLMDVLRKVADNIRKE